jgi:transketolase
MQELTPLQHLEYKIKANWVRRTVLEMAVKSKSGHITTGFSLTELFISLYSGYILRFDPTNPNWTGRDRFILSEGQSAIGLYPVLADVGFFPLGYLDRFLEEGSSLGVHSEPSTPGIQVLTGSLGHGPGIASGMAYAAKIDNISREERLIVCLTGDGELCEGSNWEALLTIQSRKLDNLVLVVNRNHQFTIGRTDCIETQRDICLDPLPEKLEAFSFETRTIDGHSFPAIFDGFSDIRTRKSNRPLAIIVDTEKGHDSHVFANKRMWHYRVPRGQDLANIREDLDIQRIKLEAELALIKKEETSNE